MNDKLKVSISSQDEDINKRVIDIVKTLFYNVKVRETDNNKPFKQAYITVDNVHKNIK